jgi:hypothetical protein
MGRKRFTVEQIIRKLREAEAELAPGATITNRPTLSLSPGNHPETRTL